MIAGRWIAGLSASALLAGCAAPRYARPDIPSPAAYRGSERTPALSGASLGELRWQDLIRDEELSELIREALAHNFDARIAAARVLEARAMLRVSRAARLPAIDASGAYNNSRASGMDVEYTNVSINLGWELDLWGRIRNLSAAARSAVLASEHARRMVVQTLVAEVAGAYFQLRDIDLELQITRHTLALREDSLALVKLRVENGYASEIELRQSEVLVKGARASLVSLELDGEQAENQLAILLGRNPGPIARSRSLPNREILASLPPGLPSALLDRRPDIQQAEQQLAGDHALLAAAKAAYFPAISLTGSGGWESPSLRSLFLLSNRSWYFGPTARLPIFQAGAIRAGVQEAEARREQSLLAYQKTVQQAFREVADALAGCRQLAELRTQQRGLVESLRAGAELADVAYKGGVASYLEYLDAERQLLDAELQLVQIRRQELTSAIALYRALGGGWQ